MTCEIPDCDNVGVHSCRRCGKLICGKHAAGGGVQLICAHHVRQDREAAESAQLKAGCTSIMLGLVGGGFFALFALTNSMALFALALICWAVAFLVFVGVIFLQ